MATTMIKTSFGSTGCESTAFQDDGNNTVITAPLIGYWAVVTNAIEFAGYVGEGAVVGLRQQTGIVTIDHPDQFHGLITLVTPTEASPLGTIIDLVGLANADGASLSGNMLNITSGGQIVDQLRLNAPSWGPGNLTVAKIGNDIDILSGNYGADPTQVLLHV